MKKMLISTVLGFEILIIKKKGYYGIWSLFNITGIIFTLIRTVRIDREKSDEIVFN